ncbi:MAG: hypothetical protein ACW99F_04945 [Candidatus Hodarchaeales archaeon]|jgi:hypothetical protein
MKNCPSCNSQISKSDIFCSHCGYNILATQIVTQANEAIVKILDLNLTTIEKFKKLQNQITGLFTIPDELENSRSYLTSLNDSFVSSSTKLHELSQMREAEEEDVRKLEKLSVTSLVARIKGDKEKKLEKERLELLNALNKEETVKKEHDRLLTVIQETEKQIQELERLDNIKQNLEKELRLLLDDACEGVADPTEDEIEGKLKMLKDSLHPFENQRGRIFRAKNHLEHAIADLQQAEKELGGASGMANWDTFFGGGLIADSIKHSKMSSARDRVFSAQNNLKNAQREYPDIPEMRGGHIEEISFFWDGFMDNIFSDLSARDKIYRSRRSVQEALDHTHTSMKFLNDEISMINREVEGKTQQIKEADDQLYKERIRMIQEAIEK